MAQLAAWVPGRIAERREERLRAPSALAYVPMPDWPGEFDVTTDEDIVWLETNRRRFDLRHRFG